ncbi:MAG: hypothetical protein K1X88_08885 [Nannocystaceae bacterium]|nr:hypothetical protein [Nannocystaceae bacterium]
MTALAVLVAAGCGIKHDTVSALGTSTGSSGGATTADSGGGSESGAGASDSGSNAGDATSSSTGAGACTGGIVWPGDLHLATAIDDPDLPCVTEVEGTVWIEAVPEITDLAALASVTRIGGPLYVGSNEALTSFDGLEALEHVGVVALSENPVLADVSALAGIRHLASLQIGRGQPQLSSVQSIAGDVAFALEPDRVSHVLFYGLDGLESLDGLTELGEITLEGDQRLRVGVADLPAITDIAALSVFAPLADRLALTAANLPLSTFAFAGEPRLGELTLVSYPALQRVELPGVTSIGELSFYHDLPQLTSLEGLEGLEHVDRLWIGQCTLANEFGLTSLTGLQGVTSIDELVIVGTQALTTIDALAEGTALGTVTIADNAALPTADVLARLALLDVSGTVTVCGNQGGEPCVGAVAPCKPIDPK